jgi:ribonuclease Y
MLDWAIILAIGMAIGILVGYWVRMAVAKKQTESAEARAKEIIKSAKIKQQEIFFKAREEALKIVEEAKKEEAERRKEIKALEERLMKRESLFDRKLLELEERERALLERTNKIEAIKEKIRAMHQEAARKLEEIAGLSKEEAKALLLEKIEEEYKEAVLERIKKLEKQASLEIEKKTRELLVGVMERLAASVATERTTSLVNLPSDEMKGRIIGREGRNIKVIEQLTGTEIIIDDTPNAIFISSFSPIRRQLAKRTLEKLIQDGRIQPARIENYVQEAKKELLEDIKQAGEEALYSLGITGVNPKLVQILGRLKYRTSFGQNVLQHSIEVANLSAILAAELGGDEILAKKAGLFHDIGKAVDHEVEGTHPVIGKELAEKYDLPPAVAEIIATHHQDYPSMLEAVVVKVADALSASRPGARRDTYEDFLKRLEDLEKIAKSFPGVEKSYAIQAGREIRVFVKPQEIDDLASVKLAREIADKIEEELKYPGEIKVTVIRENRVVEYAR